MHAVSMNVSMSMSMRCVRRIMMLIPSYIVLYFRPHSTRIVSRSYTSCCMEIVWNTGTSHVCRACAHVMCCVVVVCVVMTCDADVCIMLHYRTEDQQKKKGAFNLVEYRFASEIPSDVSASSTACAGCGLAGVFMLIMCSCMRDA